MFCLWLRRSGMRLKLVVSIIIPGILRLRGILIGWCIGMSPRRSKWQKL